MRRLAVLAILVTVALSLFGTAASAKPRRYWCARAAALHKQIADTAAQSDALTQQREARAEELEAAAQASTSQPAIVFPLYWLTPEDEYAQAEARCTRAH